MSGFIQGEYGYQSTLFPDSVDDHVEENSVARVMVLTSKLTAIDTTHE